MITSQELRKKFLDFFKEKGHQIIPSASLIPENDPTVLFTTAGMHPLIPFLLGEKHPQGRRLANCQKCIRTSDIEKVGDAWHLTFFEMLGNWSLGDYGKKEAIEWSFEFLTHPRWLNLSKDKLAITLFEGKGNLPRDEESFLFWKKLGIPENRIVFMGEEDNWWGPVGEIGPCGPDTEMFYYSNKNLPSFQSNPKNEPEKWVEIWNNVFMFYYKDKNGQISELKQKNVDTGMGLERVVAVLNGFPDVYYIDSLWPIIQKIEKLSSKKYNDNEKIKKAMRIIADHLRAATFILGDKRGITPSNLDQGYVVRRLIRRAIRYGRMIDIKEPSFTFKISEIVINQMQDIYPELKENRDFIQEQLIREEEKFNRTLEKGLKMFNKLVSINSKLNGDILYSLFSTYGFPLEMSLEIAKEEKIKVDPKAIEDFNKLMEKHREISRAGAKKRFKGGLIDHSEISKKYHTATHLLHQALRIVLGDKVRQMGSNITPERLRFDFSFPRKLTPEEIKKVEDLVNQQIEKDLPVICQEMSLEEAKKEGAIGLFENKYGEKVKVYSIGDFSKEICAGPHVKRTGVLGKFKIIKEQSSSAGVRRIKAILE